LRSQLSIAATEHQVRFTHLHEKRAEVIAEIYSRLLQLFQKLGDYVKIYEMAGDQPKEKRRELTLKAIKAFRDYFEPKIIFVPAKTAGKLQSIDSQLVSAFNEFVIKVERGQDDGDHWLAIFARVGGEIRTAMGELEGEFRRMLGEEA
jgi:hypothetical protein